MQSVSLVPARRRASRIPVGDNVWVYWECPPYRDVSRIRDLSAAGLFLLTPLRKAKNDCLFLHFLVQEGQIRLEALVRHIFPGQGLGLKLRSVVPQDIPQFDALLSRVRAESPSLIIEPVK
jgi:PilZ domain